RVVTTITRVTTRQFVLSPGLSLQVHSRSAVDFIASRGSVLGPLFAFKWLVKLLFVLDRFNRFQPNAIHEFKLHAHSPASIHMPADYCLNLIAFALRQPVERFTNVLRKLHNSSSFSKNRPQRRRKTRWRDYSRPPRLSADFIVRLSGGYVGYYRAKSVNLQRDGRGLDRCGDPDRVVNMVFADSARRNHLFVRPDAHLTAVDRANCKTEQLEIGLIAHWFADPIHPQPRRFPRVTLLTYKMPKPVINVVHSH